MYWLKWAPLNTVAEYSTKSNAMSRWLLLIPSRLLLLVKNGDSREQRQLAMHSAAAAMLLWTIGHVSEAISSLRVGSQMTPTSLLVAVIHNRYIAAAAAAALLASRIIYLCYKNNMQLLLLSAGATNLFYMLFFFLSFFLLSICWWMFLLSFYVRVFNEALLVVSRQLLSTPIATYTEILKSFFTCCILQSLAAALNV